MKYFNVDLQRAKTYSKLISEDELATISEFYENRGSQTPITKKKGKKK